jgi:hypothetical protein
MRRTDRRTGRKLLMCDSTDSAEEYVAQACFDGPSGSVVLGAAISRVVAAMSEETKVNLLESLISENLYNAGDTSTLAMFETAHRTAQVGAKWPYKPDPTVVRAVCAAASSACGMLTGGGDTDNQSTDLARATVRGGTFRDIIHG